MFKVKSMSYCFRKRKKNLRENTRKRKARKKRRKRKKVKVQIPTRILVTDNNIRFLCLCVGVTTNIKSIFCINLYILFQK